MSAQEHAASVRLALKTNRELKVLFNRLGTSEAPRGRVLTAYRQARRALAGNAGDLNVVRAVLFELRRTVEDVAYTQLQAAADLGLDQANRTLILYGIPAALVGVSISTPYDAWMATLDAQLASVLALAAQGNEEAILGDSGRVGQLSPAPVVREGARWLAFASMASLTMALDRNATGGEWQKQAVAAIDERTTDCCLRVHGQIVDFDKKFKLTGTPRYADRMDTPPFHWFCRTSVALVRSKDAEDKLTKEMRSAARVEIDARIQTGKREEIHPAHATSRR